VSRGSTCRYYVNDFEENVLSPYYLSTIFPIFSGTGLGITISNMIMNALGGQLVAFSAPEYGSCFTFAIPVKHGRTVMDDNKVESKEAIKLRTEQLQAEFEGFGFGEGSNKKRPRVLVVDDSTINRKICSRKIRKLLPGVEITECASGKSCIQEYEHDYKNIMGIFLDFHMPGMINVFCIFSCIHSQQFHSHLCLLTGMDGDVVARNIRAFEKTHEDVGQEVWIVG
jgi:CheY-like chemotaxis protein